MYLLLVLHKTLKGRVKREQRSLNVDEILSSEKTHGKSAQESVRVNC